MLTPDEIKAVVSKDHTETMEETYDIYLLPPGEDPEACQSYLRMRNRDGKYNLMFEVFSKIFSNCYNLFTIHVLPSLAYACCIGVGYRQSFHHIPKNNI